MNYVFPIKITKELIESKITQETLMETYYGVSIRKGLFKSTMRYDKNPTVSYYKNKNGRLIVKDFGSDFCGDWIYVVRNKFNCSYQKALQIVANDFNIIHIPNLEKNQVKYSNKIIENKEESLIQVEIKEFNDYELNWWKSYGISKDTLKKFKVFSCKNVFLNNNLFHLYKNKQLIFGYYGGSYSNIEYWRIYMPNKTPKFISNWKSTKIQGASQLSKNGGEYLIIQKSLKDVMCLYEFGIQSIAPCSENLFINKSILEKLKLKYKNIIVWYDTDIAGISNLQKIRKQYPELKYFFIPRHYNVKDFSDFYKKYGKEKAKLFLDNYITKLLEK